MDISIILPCYNEINNMGLMIDDLMNVMPSNKKYEIIVVDDDSSDGTSLFLENKYKDMPNIRTIVRKEDRSLAKSIRTGIDISCGNHIIVMDSDYNHPPAYVPLFCKILESPNVDIVVGSRFLFGGASTSKNRFLLSKIYNVFINTFLGSSMTDNLTGFFGIRRDKIMLLDFDKIFWGYGDYYFRFLAYTQGYGLYHVQVPIKYGHRKFGESKTRFLKIFFKYTSEVLRFSFKRLTGDI